MVSGRQGIITLLVETRRRGLCGVEDNHDIPHLVIQHKSKVLKQTNGKAKSITANRKAYPRRVVVNDEHSCSDSQSTKSTTIFRVSLPLTGKLLVEASCGSLGPTKRGIHEV